MRKVLIRVAVRDGKFVVEGRRVLDDRVVDPPAVIAIEPPMEFMFDADDLKPTLGVIDKRLQIACDSIARKLEGL